METLETNAGWRLGRSIALELDTALSIAGPARGWLNFARFAPIRELVAGDWRQDWETMLGKPRSSVAVLQVAALLADVLFEADYGRATLAIRELTAEDACSSLEERANDTALPTVRSAGEPVSAGERVTKLLLRLFAHEIDRIGIQLIQFDALARALARETEQALRILKGGDLHISFWHWMDRFYYEAYRPWRTSADDRVTTSEARARSALGAVEFDGTPPSIHWLSPHHPIHVNQELRTAVQTGRTRIFFWAEPFGLPDSMTFAPGWLLVSFSELDEAVSSLLLSEAERVTARLKALSDPTRLSILRLIRHFGMDNTEMANYFGLSRPTVSNHAKILHEAGLIRTRHVGRQARHELIPEALQQLHSDLANFLDLPEPASGKGDEPKA